LFNEDNVMGIETNFSVVNFTAIQLRAGGCTTCVVLNPNGTVNNAQSEAAVFQRIFNGGIQQFVLNYINAASTPIAQRTLNSREQPNSFQPPRNVRFGLRFFF